MESALRINGLANARDLGGLDRKDGTVTPTGVFVRSERLDRIESDGWRQLHAYGVRTVIDLRRPDERTGQVPASMRHKDLCGQFLYFDGVIRTDRSGGSA